RCRWGEAHRNLLHRRRRKRSACNGHCRLICRSSQCSIGGIGARELYCPSSRGKWGGARVDRRAASRAGSHRTGSIHQGLKASAFNDISRIPLTIGPMKLSDYVLRFVADQGVKHVFLVTGGGAMHLNASLATEKRLIPICNLHEQASAIAAENYSKATNNLGVCMVTTGPGSTNAVTGLAGAWLDSTPTLFISGQVKRPDRAFDSENKPLGMRQVGGQEVDIVSIVHHITKYARTVLDAGEIRYHLEKAIYLARTGRPGPVWIDIPLDVQASPIDDPACLRRFDPLELAAVDSG